MKFKNHWLQTDSGTPVTVVKTTNQGQVIHPLYLVIHYTAGLDDQGAINWFRNPASTASAHFVVGRNGEVTQMVACNRRAWHAGKSQWGQLTDLNSHSIGIEIANAGKLSQLSDGTWLTWSKHPVPADQVTVATHKHEKNPAGWHEYTSAQIDAIVAIGLAVKASYGILDVLGHDDISPDRKVDPGPLFPMGSVSSKIMGRD